MLKRSMQLGPAGFLLVVLLCWATSADAQYRRYYKYYRFYDPYAETQRQGERDRYSRRQRGEERMREAQSERETDRKAESAQGRRGSGAFSAVVEQMIRVCGHQAIELKNWPFDSISQTVRAEESQRGALDELRRIATQTAEKLNADCPREIPAAPAARLDEAQRGIEVAIGAITTLQPAIKTFYGALDDEQKARLVAKSLTANLAQDANGRRSRSREDERAAAAAQWDAICANLAAALRDWPVTRIERNVGLSETQRIAFYDVVAASMKAAGALIVSCPSEPALTPVGRMEVLRQRLEAMQRATMTIHPALVQFYEALDNKQKLRFAEMN